ncbi:hypothetical protein BCEN4_370143 [Burkholderia cenocepacia]|nr:hypothetical protein BCEN4_370143 [Burkholderia cenocepacia]
MAPWRDSFWFMFLSVMFGMAAWLREAVTAVLGRPRSRMAFLSQGGRGDLSQFAAQLVGQTLVLQDLLELATEHAVVEQIRLEVAQQIAHRQHRLQLGNLPSNLLGLEILHRAEREIHRQLRAVAGQGVLGSNLQIRRVVGEDGIEVVLVDVDLLAFSQRRLFAARAEVTRDKQLQRQLDLLLGPARMQIQRDRDTALRNFSLEAIHLQSLFSDGQALSKNTTHSTRRFRRQRYAWRNAQHVSIDIPTHGLRSHGEIALDLYTPNPYIVKASRT